eukprot:gene12676-16141_t
MRPRRLAEVVGQQHILKPDSLLPRLVAQNRFGSLLFYGPPGCGKTSIAEAIAHETGSRFVRINAVMSNVAELREILAAARREAPAPGPNLWQRWLQACQRPRWQMAFATVAGVALMIGVVMRSPVPDIDLPEAAEYAAAPPPQALSAPAAPAPMARMAMAPQADSASVQAEMAAVMADEPVAKMSKQIAAKPQSLEQGLEEIVHLREAGE